MEHECAANHLPSWTENLTDVSLEDNNILIAYLDNYNDNIDKLRTCDPFDAYGIEAEQEELIRLMMIVYNKYKGRLYKNGKSIKHRINKTQ